MQPDYHHIHQDIVDNCRKGDSHAQYQLYQLYSKPMLNVAARILKSKEEAEDILQDAFVDVFLKLDSFRGEASFGSWFKRIVINKSLNQLKKNNKIVLEEEVQQSDEVQEAVVMEEKEVEYTIQDIQKTMLQLPDGYRIVFNLYAFEDYSHKEIAKELGITESTSKSQYNRAKKKIKELVQSIEHEDVR